MYKQIKTLIPVFDIDMGGVKVKQALPTQKVPHFDPFLLLHHASFKFNAKRLAKHQGLGPHPHRGFTPVTFVIEGEVHHRDSRGNDQVAKKGEVQWMHAGAGIIHSERPSQDLVAQKGTQEIIQLWINSPSHRKMAIPKYQHVSEEKINHFYSSDRLIRTKVISGIYEDIVGNITSESELIVLWADAQKNGSQLYSITSSYATALYVINGRLKIKDYGMVSSQTLALFELNEEAIEIDALEDCSFLILAGLPMNEPIVQQGPYVMNTETEILEAMRDYSMGKMGILIED